ncbi:P-loop containing nucleoside triphosphate hydrolase protein [Amanita rubescens]|nr:P-loop containing nucleoside triphosphate hydrolase protein [Amanita rubescens]
MLKSPPSSPLKSVHLGDKFHKHHKRKASHDEENRHRKPVKVNGTLHIPHGLLNGRKHKKARHSYGGDAEPNGLVNGMKSSSPGGIKFTALQEQRKQLPIAKGREALIEEIRKNEVTILIGETGSGKTTQVPQYLLESGISGPGIIAVTQPRRVAATTLASRVALEQNGSSVGKLVGYSVRFDEKYSPETRIKYMTDGMIVQELLSDPLLSRYSVVIVDEAHERTLRTDLLLANLKTILKKRRGGTREGKGKGKWKEDGPGPLKIVVMSATLDAGKFSKFFHDAKILYIKGRQHPVKIFHSTQGQPDYVDAAMRTFFQIHTDQPSGDVLIFLPGQEDIDSLEKSIQLFANRLPQDKMQVLITPMYAAQSPGANAKVFATTPSDTRKCILATNIAETSITIPGVKYVIDTGKCKEKRYLARDTGGGFDTLLTRDITKSSAMQRTGRAGREGPGFCFRLYTEESFNNMPVSPEPEIMRNQDLEDLDLMDKPDQDSIISALKTLWLLSALDNSKRLTEMGRQMALFPLEPTHARSILASHEYGCAPQVLSIISILSASSKLFVDVSGQRENAAEARKAFVNIRGDHLTILNVVRAYEDVCRGQEQEGPGKEDDVTGDDGYVKKKGKGKGKAERKEWCRRYWVNERTLIEAREIRKQLQGACHRLGWTENLRDIGGSGEKDEENILLSMGSGLVQNSAFLQPDGTYKQTMGRSIVKIHPGSVLAEKKVPAIVYDELIYTNQIYARGVSAIPRSFFATYSALNQRKA